MYPQADLDLLAQRKRALRLNIRLRRDESAMHLAEIARPVVWLEGMYAKWKAISPLVKVAAVPVGVLLKQKLFPGGGLMSGLLRWAPVAVNLFRSRR